MNWGKWFSKVFTVFSVTAAAALTGAAVNVAAAMQPGHPITLQAIGTAAAIGAVAAVAKAADNYAKHKDDPATV